MGVPSHGPDRGWYWEVVLVWLTRPMLIHSTPTSVTADQPRPVAEMKQLVQRSGKPSLPSHKTGHCWHWTWRYCQTTLSKLDCFSFQETSCCLHPAHQQADGIPSFLHSFIKYATECLLCARHHLRHLRSSSGCRRRGHCLRGVESSTLSFTDEGMESGLTRHLYSPGDWTE